MGVGLATTVGLSLLKVNKDLLLDQPLHEILGILIAIRGENNLQKQISEVIDYLNQCN